MTAVVVSLAVLTAGAVIAAAALYRWGWRGLSLAVGAIALSPAVGYGPLSLAAFAWLWSGRLGGRPALVALAFAIAATLVGLTPRRAPVPRRRGEPLPRSLALALVAAGMVALGAATVAAPRLLRARPIGTYDAHAIWNAHARFLYRAEDNPARLFRRMHRGHPDYPLLVPGVVAGIWSLVGEEAAAVPPIVSGAFLLATAFAIGAALAARHRPFAGCLGAALYLSTPSALRWGAAQCADVPLSYCLTLAAVGCAGLLDDEADAPLPPSWAGFLLGLLAWTKIEGWVLAALLTGLLAAVWHFCRGRRPGRSPAWPATLGAAAPLLALLLFELYWSPRSEFGLNLAGATVRLTDPTRWGTVATGFLTELDPFRSWRRWGVVWPFALAGCIWTAAAAPAWREPGRALLGLTLGGGFCAYIFMYVAGAHDPAWWLRTSLERLLLQMLPLALVCGLDWPGQVITAGDPGPAAVAPPIRGRDVPSPNR